MKHYILLQDGEYVPTRSRHASGEQLASELGIEYSDDMELPEGWVELVCEPVPALTKYQTIQQEIVEVDGVWTRRINVLEGDERHIRIVDNHTTTTARKYRDELLAASDWTQMPDSPLSEEKKAEWAEYRQALRDITADEAFPTYHQMPSKPE
jgi:hypothetical protein